MSTSEMVLVLLVVVALFLGPFFLLLRPPFLFPGGMIVL
jgi:hypothetical protein